jgi:hypothetical protein
MWKQNIMRGAHKNPSKCVGLVQSDHHHHHIEILRVIIMIQRKKMLTCHLVTDYKSSICFLLSVNKMILAMIITGVNEPLMA